MRSFYGKNYFFKHFIFPLWSIITLSTLKSQLNTNEQENTMCVQDSSYNDCILCSKWSQLNVESTVVKLSSHEESNQIPVFYFPVTDNDHFRPMEKV
jgi:hypothetical protein